MFLLEEGAQLALPTGVRKIITTFSATGSMGGYGQERFEQLYEEGRIMTREQAIALALAR